jgi:hypothetical protein
MSGGSRGLADDELLRYADARESVPSAAAQVIAAHLVDCPSCRDEVALLASVRIEPVSVAEPRRVWASSRSWLESLLEPLGKLAMRPAFAYGVAAALMVSTLVWLDPVAVIRRSQDGSLRSAGHQRSDTAFERGSTLQSGAPVLANNATGETAVALSAGSEGAQRETARSAAAEGVAGTPLEASATPLAPAASGVPGPQLQAFAYREGDRERGLGTKAPASAPSIAYIAGGRVVVGAASALEHAVVVRIDLGNELPKARERANAAVAGSVARAPASLAGQDPAGVVSDFAGSAPSRAVELPADASRLELRVINAEGKTTARTVVEPSPGGVLPWTIELKDLSPGDNRLALFVPGAGEPLVAPLILELRP